MANEIGKRVGRAFTIGLALVSLFGVIGVFAHSLYLCFAPALDLSQISPEEQPIFRQLQREAFRQELVLTIGWGLTVLALILVCWNIFFPPAKQSMPAARPKEIQKKSSGSLVYSL